MDESGDLGFKGKSSRYFIIGYIITEQSGRISTDIKRVLKNLNKKHKHSIREFKFSNDSDFIRLKVLNLFRRLDIDGGQVVIKKSAVKSDLRDNKSLLYNYLVAENIATSVVEAYADLSEVNLHLDSSMSSASRDHFNSYFSDKMRWKISIFKRHQSVKTKIYHDYSHNEACIQLADYLAGSLYQLYEHEQPKYYDLIKEKITHKQEWG
ncbi:DUF3800 domain-containing protein [Nitrososphaera sp. AFS]|uniref:DUF3800 domain-containing protein n=1 Tax=Nitrososphaera sp. AFS TaxID=2301191 RepID=UPI00351AF961